MARVPNYIKGKPRSIEAKHLWEHHHEILRLLTVGYQPKEISEILNIETQAICNIRNSELGRAVLTALREKRDEEAANIGKVIREEAEQSFYFLQKVRRGELDASLSQRIRVAEGLLDREPKTAKVRRTEGHVAHAHLTKSEIDELKEQARQAEMEAISERSVLAEAEVVEGDG